MKRKGIVFIVLGLVVGALLCYGCDMGKGKQLQGQIDQLNQTIQQKDTSIKTLTGRVAMKEKELNNIKTELDNTKKELGAVKKELDALNQKVNASAQAPATTPAITSTPVQASTPAPTTKP